MNRHLAPADRVVVAYYAIIVLVTLAAFPQVRWGAAHLGWCAFVIGTVLGLARRAASGGAAAGAAHDWFPIVALLAAFQQLTWLIPDVHPFEDLRFDHALAALDASWFGDVRGFFRRITTPLLTDLLSLCYWSYYPMPMLLVGTLWVRKERGAFREASAVILAAFFLSYLGYIVVPAIGPLKAVDGLRDAALEGLWVSGPLHRALMAIEGRIADAFPSGHTLVAVTTVLLAWRMQRRVFWIILPAATGLVTATMYLRYHYVVDVLGGLALVAPAFLVGRRLAAGPPPT